MALRLEIEIALIHANLPDIYDNKVIFKYRRESKVLLKGLWYNLSISQIIFIIRASGS